MAGFKKLVDTSDYSKSDMNDIREWLKSLVKRK